MNLVLVNGTAFCRLGRRPLCVGIQDGVITATGEFRDVTSAVPAGTEQVDLSGALIVPGLVDGHIHLLAYGLSQTQVDADAPDREEALSRVRNWAQEGWILGGGWNRNLWTEPPDRNCLDEASRGRPAALFSKDHHALWVNSRALELARIGRDTPSPRGGEIVRDERGEPTGVLLENAMRQVLEVIPPPGVDTFERAVLQAEERLFSLGLVGVHNCEGLDSLQTLCGLAATGRLRLFVWAHIPPEGIGHARALGFGPKAGYPRLELAGVKTFADGALGSQTADMLCSYEGSDSRGIEVTSSEQLLAVGLEARAAGFPLAIHAIGDRAVRRALDAAEAVPAPAGRPHRIEHAQLISEPDRGRFAQLGVVASMQPIHAPSDRDVAERQWGERCRGAYAWRDLLDSGAVLAFGSDAPVESPDPMLGLTAAVSRKLPDDDRGPWRPEQALRLDEALLAYSQGTSHAVGDLDGGRIQPGRPADLTVLAPDPFTVEPAGISACRPTMTIVGGRVVFSR